MHILAYALDPPPVDSLDRSIYLPKRFPIIYSISSLQSFDGKEKSLSQIGVVEGSVLGSKNGFQGCINKHVVPMLYGPPSKALSLSDTNMNSDTKYPFDKVTISSSPYGAQFFLVHEYMNLAKDLSLIKLHIRVWEYL